MRLRRCITTCLAVAAVTGPSVAHAATGDTDLARQATTLLRREADLIPLAGPEHAADLEWANHRAQLEQVDAAGAAVLDRMLAGGMNPSSTVRYTLDRLPKPGTGTIPSRQDYNAALVELERSSGARGGATLPAAQASHSLLIGGLVSVIIALASVLGGWLLRRRRQASDLVEIAMTDALTSVANRRRLDRDVAAMADTATAELAVLMLDVDHFKLVNDTYGHATGDEVLRRVGRVLKEQMRPTDTVYRYGGEEFCAVLQGARLRDAVLIAERIRTAVTAAAMPIDGPVTVSVGAASGRSADVTALIDQADAALYDAKQRGRDRVATATAPVPSTPVTVLPTFAG